MKTKFSKLTKFIILVCIVTFTCGGVLVYALDKANEETPDLKEKIENALRSHYNDKNLRLDINFDSGSVQKTTYGYEAAIDEVRIRTQSGDIHVKAKKNATQVTITTDEKTSLQEFKITDDKLLKADGDFNFGSSDVIVELPESFSGKLFLSSMSGDIDIQDISADRVEINTADGDIDLNQVSIKKSILKTVSGDIEIRQQVAGEIQAETASGDLDFKLSKTSEGFRFDIKTASGEIKNSVDQKMNGVIPVSISTASGNVRIE